MNYTKPVFIKARHHEFLKRIAANKDEKMGELVEWLIENKFGKPDDHKAFLPEEKD